LWAEEGYNFWTRAPPSGTATTSPIPQTLISCAKHDLTHYYGVEDTYSRIDYLMVSPGMAREWVKEQTFIPTLANWGLASDHRPLLATFEAENR